MANKKISDITNTLASINTGDLIEVAEYTGPGTYAEASYDIGHVADAISTKHTQNTDTALGTLTADIDMNNTYQVVSLAAPAAAGEAIRQTTNITELNLEELTDGSNTTLHDHSLGTAATKDHGTASGEVPLNSDLGSIATKDFWSGTQAQYDALGTYDSGTIYFIEAT